MVPNLAHSMGAVACLGLNTLKSHKLDCCSASRNEHPEEMQVPNVALEKCLPEQTTIFAKKVYMHVIVCPFGECVGSGIDNVPGQVCVVLGCGCVCLGWLR